MTISGDFSNRISSYETSSKNRRVESEPHLLILSENILENIFSYISGKEQCRTVALVNKEFAFIHENYSPFGQLIILVKKISQQVIQGSSIQKQIININSHYEMNAVDKLAFQQFVDYTFELIGPFNHNSNFHQFKRRFRFLPSVNFFIAETIAVGNQDNENRLIYKRLAKSEFKAIQSLINNYLIPGHLTLVKQLMRGCVWDLKSAINAIAFAEETPETKLFASDLQQIEKLFACIQNKDATADTIKSLDWSYCFRYSKAFYKNSETDEQFLLGEQFIEWIFNYPSINSLECDSLFNAVGQILLNPSFNSIPYWIKSHEILKEKKSSYPIYFLEKRAFVLVVAEYSANVLQSAPVKFWADKEVVMLALKTDSNVRVWVHPSLLYDRDVLIEFCRDCDYDSGLPIPISKLPDAFKKDEEVILAVCTVDPDFFNDIDDSFKTDPKFLLKLIQVCSSCFIERLDGFNQDENFIDQALDANVMVYKHLKDEFKANRKFALKIFIEEYENLDSDDIPLFLLDEEFYLEAYKKEKSTINSIPYPKNKDLILKIIKEDKEAIKYLSSTSLGLEIEDNKNLYFDIIDQDINLFLSFKNKWAKFERFYFNLIVNTLSHNKNGFYLLSEEEKRNIHLILEAVANNSSLFFLYLKEATFLSQSEKEDFILSSLIKNPSLFELVYGSNDFDHMHPDIRDRASFLTFLIRHSCRLPISLAREIVSIDGLLLEKMTTLEKNNQDIVSQAANQNILALKYADQRLLKISPYHDCFLNAYLKKIHQHSDLFHYVLTLNPEHSNYLILSSGFNDF